MSGYDQPSLRDSGINQEEAHRCTELLESLVENRGLLAGLPEDLKKRLLTAAGQVSKPQRADQELLWKANRRKKQAAAQNRKKSDQEILNRTGIRRQRRQAVFPTPRPGHSGEPMPGADQQPLPDLCEDRTCYTCKQSYRRVHHFYDALCPACAELNWQKRFQTYDLRGRVGLITGARVKIGYQAAIMLLRSGMELIVLTRFPRDAAARYAKEPDFKDWYERLHIYGLDLRHTPSVEAFTAYVLNNYSRLDFILNNACQTVRRPPGFYQHLMEGEEREFAALSEGEQKLLARHQALKQRPAVPGLAAHRTAGVERSAELSQLALLDGDLDRGGLLFPKGQLDADLQQIDMRKINSWRLPLAAVSAVELLEVHLVNAVAPFILNARLKPLMMKTPERDKHIVNVSAMEGQFYRAFKTDKHPHTNMAKAALNMMTRTSAADYIKDGIHMNSVDTGWITDEDPIEITRRKQEDHDFHPPLDLVDAAARICDPIFSGFINGEHLWGLFLKDYRPVHW